jgi:membrane protein YqaA with SNARE-associated domain
MNLPKTNKAQESKSSIAPYTDNAVSRKKPNVIRRLYDWVLSWAESPHGSIALFSFGFAEASFFPIPPDPLLIALILQKKEKALGYALLCTLASVTGGILGYFIGYAFMKEIGMRIIEFYNATSIFQELLGTFSRHSFWAVLVAAITPIPYKVFTITAGFAAATVPGINPDPVSNIIFLHLVTASILGRGFRFGLISFLLYIYGATVKNFIDKYFNLLVTVFTFLLLGGFFIIKFFIK